MLKGSRTPKIFKKPGKTDAREGFGHQICP
jgi:hypothetical protein